MKDLCSIIDSVLGSGKRELASLDVALSFLGTFVDSYGHAIENAALRKLGGSAISVHSDDLGRMLEQMLAKVVSAAENSLGGMWKRQVEQGQVPFESRTQLTTNSDSASSDCLSGTLDLQTKCLENCPLFILHVPAELGEGEDKLLRRAVDSATAYLSDENPDLAKSSLRFLQTLVSHTVCFLMFSLFENNHDLSKTCSRRRISLHSTPYLKPLSTNHAPESTEVSSTTCYPQHVEVAISPCCMT